MLVHILNIAKMMPVTSYPGKHMTSLSFLTLVLPFRWLIFINVFHAVNIAIKQQQYCNTIRPQLRPCHTRQFSLQLATQWRCIASCKENFLVWHPMFATSLATKNCVPSCRESRSSFYLSQCYATSCSVWHPHCNLSRNFYLRNQSQYGGRKI